MSLAGHLGNRPGDRRQLKDLVVRPFSALAAPLRTDAGNPKGRISLPLLKREQRCHMSQKVDRQASRASLDGDRITASTRRELHDALRVTLPSVVGPGVPSVRAYGTRADGRLVKRRALGLRCGGRRLLSYRSRISRHGHDIKPKAVDAFDSDFILDREYLLTSP